MRLLAIDPGFERIGIAIIDQDKKRNDTLVYSECFKTKAALPFPQRLALIGAKLEEIIATYSPRALAIEKLYMSVNQKTAMGVAEARGVIIYSASKHGLKVYEYTPPQIKLAVTGYGKATKEMIMSMVPKLIRMEKKTSSDDEVDAIAIGLTSLACEKFS